MALALLPLGAAAQSGAEIEHDLEFRIEAAGIAGSGDHAPFWHTSNRQGLPSVKPSNGYMHFAALGGIGLPGDLDAGYGVDLGFGTGLESDWYVHQLYVDLDYKWLGMSVLDQYNLVIAGLFLDIGKLRVPREILEKQGSLTDSEFEMVKRHAQFGYDMLSQTTMNANQDIMQGVQQHHERCDGSGYPNGLKGDKISKFGKILAILDIYDAMASANLPLTYFQPCMTIFWMASWIRSMVCYSSNICAMP